MSLSKKIRFEIFERDAFTCQYCGQKPPEVILHVDHLVSKKDGGQDEKENLITSCQACNLGKSSKSLPKKPTEYKKKLDDLKEKTTQLESYYNFLQKKNKESDKILNIYSKAWSKAFGDTNELTAQGLKNMQNLLNRGYTSTQIFEAITITGKKFAGLEDTSGSFKYMCGVLKNLKLQHDDPEKAAHMKWAYQYRYKLINQLDYINNNLYWKWINDGIIESSFEEALKNSNSWSDLKQYIINHYYNG